MSSRFTSRRYSSQIPDADFAGELAKITKPATN